MFAEITALFCVRPNYSVIVVAALVVAVLVVAVLVVAAFPDNAVISSHLRNEKNLKVG